MSVVHLSTRGGILCRSTRHNPRVSTDLQFVTCSWCFHTLERVALIEGDASTERRWMAAAGADCEAAGVGHIWSTIQGQTPTDQMLRGVIASLARYYLETGAPAARSA